MTFSITGPGIYRMRNGEPATVRYLSDSSGNWVGDHAGTTENQKAWKSSGMNLYIADTDIIAGPLDEQQKMAGLSGYAAVAEDYIYLTQTKPRLRPDDTTPVIDLSKVPKSAIVMPEPKRITGWMNIYDRPNRALNVRRTCLGYPGTNIYASLEEAVEWGRTSFARTGQRPIARIKISYTEGEGL